jgi:hypothetical protein
MDGHPWYVEVFHAGLAFAPLALAWWRSRS